MLVSSHFTSALTLASGRLAAASASLRSVWSSSRRVVVECHLAGGDVDRVGQILLSLFVVSRHLVLGSLEKALQRRRLVVTAIVLIVDQPHNPVVVLLQRDRERLRAREEALLQRLQHEAAGHARRGVVVPGVGLAVSLEQGVELDLLLGVGGLESGWMLRSGNRLDPSQFFFSSDFMRRIMTSWS